MTHIGRDESMSLDDQRMHTSFSPYFLEDYPYHHHSRLTVRYQPNHFLSLLGEFRWTIREIDVPILLLEIFDDEVSWVVRLSVHPKVG